MSVRMTAGGVELAGDCPAADAESLVRALTEMASPHVDWRTCERAHSAVLQILMRLPAGALIGPPAGAFLRNWVAPAIGRSPGAGLS